MSTTMSDNKERPQTSSDRAPTYDDVDPTPQPSEWNAASIAHVIGSASSLFICVGFMNAYGIFQEYYQQHELADRSAFDIAWIGSMATFLMMLVGAPAGFLADKYGPTRLLAGGSVALLLGVFMTSLCEQYWQFFLAQGVLMGAAMGTLMLPVMSTIPYHFTAHRGLASGIVISGSSLGGVVWPIVDEQLLNRHHLSFGWTMRINGFIMLPLAIIVVLTVRRPGSIQPQQPKTSGYDAMTSDRPPSRETVEKPKRDLSVLKTPLFASLALGAVLFNFGMFAPFFFTPIYATSLSLSTSFAFHTLSIMNGASLFGRIGIGSLADRFGAFNLICISSLVGAVVAFCWTAAETQTGVGVWAAAYGFSSGAILSLQMHCASAISTKETSGTVIGAAFGLCSIAGLVGSPIGGELLPKGFLPLSMYVAAMLLAGAVSFIVARLLRSRDLRAKV